MTLLRLLGHTRLPRLLRLHRPTDSPRVVRLTGLARLRATRP